MNLTTYFIKHPVIALVLNAMILIVGILSFNRLALREYPFISFPTLTVTAVYPNATADVVESAVTTVLEDKLSGVEGLLDMQSKTSAGQVEITLNFNDDILINNALAIARDAVSLAQADLPKDLKQPIVKKKELNDNGPPFIAISIESDGSDVGALTHYASLNLENAFRSVPGVASVVAWGQEYTYEIVIDPKKLFLFGINADEVYGVLDKSRASLPVGKFQDQIPTTLIKSLTTKEDYENLVIKSATEQSPAIFLRSVATVQQKSDDKSVRVRVNGKPGVVIVIRRGMDANPVDVSTLVNKKVEEIKENLPKDLRMDVVLDQAVFVKSSIDTIKSSIVEAIVLVLGIVFLFLRSFHATLVPLVTIPISLLGSMIFLSMFGYSINIMTLLAMVLAIGLVVDDAIVVLENIVHHIEKGLKPIDAALVAGREIGFAIVAMTFTLVSVFMPIAFVKGAIGQLFVEFAVALAGSVLVSGIVALTLSPLMCAQLLKKERSNLWPEVDRFLAKLAHSYDSLLDWVLPKIKFVSVMMFFSVCLTNMLVKLIPAEMTPKEDRSLMGIWIPPIPGKDINALDQRITQVQNRIGFMPEAENVLVFAGDWGATLCFGLKPKKERGKSALALKQEVYAKLVDFPSVDLYPWIIDSGLPGLDSSDGSDLKMIISTVDSYSILYGVAEKLTKVSRDTKAFPALAHDLNLNSKAYVIDFDSNLLAALNLDSVGISKLLSIFFSGDMTLTFNKDGVFYPITIKGERKPWTLDELYMTNKMGSRISLGTVGVLKSTANPDTLFHYNQMRSLSLAAQVDDNIPLVRNMDKLKMIVDANLPSGYRQTWIGIAKAYKESASTMMTLILLAIVFIYAILSVQFESFLDPLIVMLTVPLAAMGALFVLWIFGQTMNIYTQIGLITLIGLITKNGILIVEFANQQLKNGMTTIDAVKKAAQLRLRPILMTTSAMILGTIPLVLSNSSGSESRRVIGAILVGGLSFGTLLTLVLLPTLYVAIKRK
jgi:multidrug efflux pump